MPASPAPVASPGRRAPTATGDRLHATTIGLFQRADAVPGLGLGLAMVRRIVECHGGRVWATARPGQGASFGFSLPADAG